MSAHIIRGDALRLPLPDDSVDLVVTSPPYFGLRSYQDGGEHYEGQVGAEATPADFVAALVAATREMTRVLKPSGSIFVNLGDKYCADNRGSGGDAKRGAAKWAPAGPGGYPGEGIVPKKSLMLIPERYRIACLDELGLIARAVIVWDKPNSMPESVQDRVRRSHEDWVHFTKEPKYYSAMDEIRESYEQPDRIRNDVFGGKSSELGVRHAGAGTYTGPTNALGKLPGSVWRIPTQPLKVPDHLGLRHFAAFPMEWPRRIIKGWCPQGGTVLDPFGGTGTTALVASVLGMRGISVDMSHDYSRLAVWRTTDRGQIASAMQVEKPAPVNVAQEGLFDAVP